MDATAKVGPRKPSARFNAWLARRIPPDERITLSQSNIFIFPTKAGFTFGGLVSILILGAINYQNSLVYGVAFLLGGLFTITILYTFRNLSGLTIEMADAHTGFVDENVKFSVRALRPKGKGREGIQIGWPEGFKQWVEIFEEEAAVVDLYVHATHRGWLRPGRLLVETYYPLGLLRAWTWVDINAQALVFPKPIFAQGTPMAAGEHCDDGVLMDPLGSEDFTDIRDYVAGDSIRNILWRSYARSDKLLVKRYASYMEPRLWLEFDKTPGDVEEKLSRLTGLALQATRRGREFGLRMPTGSISAGLGPAHLDRVLRELALYGQFE